MLSNFFGNEVWTFRGSNADGPGRWHLTLRMLKFQGICGIGIVLAVVLLNLFYCWLGINLYVSNLLAILLVTLWNFWMNALFDWGRSRMVIDKNQVNDVGTQARTSRNEGG